MKFTEAIASLNDSNLPRCVVGRWLDQLPPEDRQAITKALQTQPRFKIYRALRVMGLSAAQETFYRHETNRCRCAE